MRLTSNVVVNDTGSGGLANWQPISIAPIGEPDPLALPPFCVAPDFEPEPEPEPSAATEVWTAQDLEDVKNNLAGNYIQMADIDLSGHLPGDNLRTWNPIDNFAGSYDGGGFSITGVKLNRLGHVGFFGTTTQPNALIKNINMEIISVIGYEFVGSLVGVLGEGSHVENCSVSGGLVEGQSVVGGFVGLMTSNSSIYNCDCSVNVTAHFLSNDYVGYVWVGTGTQQVPVNYCSRYAGGFAGVAQQESELNNCHASGNVSVGNDWAEDQGFYGMWSGGFISWVTNSSVYNCSATGNATGSFNVAGFTGAMGASEGISKTEKCYARGSAFTHTDSGSIMIYYNNAWHRPLRAFGGYVGHAQDANCHLLQCYCTGSAPKIDDDDWIGVYGDWDRGWYQSGGFAGLGHNDVNVDNNYYNTDNTIHEDNYLATPKTTAEMKDKETYVGWDFYWIWSISAEINDGYPALQMRPALEVWTAEDLDNVRNNLSGHYVQMADIDLTGYENWDPLGMYKYIGQNLNMIPFTGTYDGNGFTISNLVINNEEYAYFGLFGHVSGGTLQNITLNNAILSDLRNVANLYGCGGLVGFAGGSTIQNCTIEDITFTCTNRTRFFGGIVGQFTAWSMVDELGGILINSAVINVSAVYENTGSIGTFTNWGGIAGWLNNIYYDVEECYVTGVVNTGSQTNGYVSWAPDRETAGGFAGFARQRTAEPSVYIRNCYARVETRGSQVVGGFVGFGHAQQQSTPIMYYSRCYAAGLVVSHNNNANTGGFAGRFEGPSNNQPRVDGTCYYDSEVSTRWDTGKGIPKTTAEMKEQSTFVSWDFENVWFIDPIVNEGYPHLQEYSEFTEIWTPEDLYNVRNNLDGDYIQMADIDLTQYQNWEPIGSWYGTTQEFTGSYNGNGFIISNLMITNLPVAHSSYDGGLFGATNGAVLRNISIYKATIDVDGSYNIGSLCGIAQESTIIDCRSVVVNIKGQEAIGGLVGNMHSTTVRRCYIVFGRVECTSMGGGLIGYGTLSTIEDNYCRINVVGTLIGGFGSTISDSDVLRNYCSGTIQGASDIYGFMASHTGTITSCYFDHTLSGIADGYATAKTTAEMKVVETYIDWDFEETWHINGILNDGYPYICAATDPSDVYYWPGYYPPMPDPTIDSDYDIPPWPESDWPDYPWPDYPDWYFEFDGPIGIEQPYYPPEYPEGWDPEDPNWDPESPDWYGALIPTKYRLSALYLSHQLRQTVDPISYATLIGTFIYSDGTRDYLKLPLRSDVFVIRRMKEGWVKAEGEIEIPWTKELVEVKISVHNRSLSGTLYVTNISLIPLIDDVLYLRATGG